MEPDVLQNCRAWMPKIPSTIARTCLRNCVRKPPLRLIFPFNTYLGLGVTHLAREIRHTWNILLRGILSEIDVQVGFRNYGIPLYIALPRLNN